ncbi:uncharacterized protein LOC112903904 [Agrilus planipennis]|uniref:Uncharacterized protein LOC112903904 n=1 Tax=Agrilus planipennis TaxID=224129 RepID=A0A7F5QVK9_AGRPL|nr:uncharacterized protein LOC112903904 [Agrilus planipennis]
MNNPVFVVIVFAFLKLNFAWGTAGEIPYCHYQLEEKTVAFNDSTVNVTIPGKQLIVSLCATSIKDTCKDEVSACIIDEIHPQESIYNLGEYFVFTKDQNGNHILKSINGHRCKQAANKNYSLVIHLDCDDLLKNGPMFLSMQRCEYHIRMLHPACSPRCTIKVGVGSNYLLDLQNLENLGDIKVSNTNVTFYVSLCGPATNCGNSYPEYMACELQNNVIHPIANLETQHVNYNDNSGVLSVRGRTGGAKSNRKYAELLLKCNWEETNVAAEFQKIYHGNKYTFQLESRHFCFKLPSECLVTNRQYLYDITNLSNHGRNGWLVNGLSTNFIIYINVCGPLQNNVGKCKEELSMLEIWKFGGRGSSSIP